MATQQKVIPFLWFQDNAEEALRFYLSVFEGSKLVSEQRWGEGGMGPKGSLMTATFSLGGQQIAVLNGNPDVRFHDSMSLAVSCESQAEVDRLWSKLTADGGEPGHCGWLKDKFGVSWQIIPAALPRLLSDPDRARAGRVMQAMLQMGKIDIAGLEAAAQG